MYYMHYWITNYVHFLVKYVGLEPYLFAINLSIWHHPIGFNTFDFIFFQMYY